MRSCCLFFSLSIFFFFAHVFTVFFSFVSCLPFLEFFFSFSGTLSLCAIFVLQE